jgi:hypothetical protein
MVPSTTEVKVAGAVPLQTVCEVPIDPAVIVGTERLKAPELPMAVVQFGVVLVEVIAVILKFCAFVATMLKLAFPEASETTPVTSG